MVKNTDYNTKVAETENKLNNHNHDKYITTLAANVFNARLSQTHLMTKTNFDNTVSSLKLLIIEQKTNILKMNLKG